MRHHYVPQFLLRAWADGAPDKKIEVFRLDLTHLPSSRLTPKHTGYEDDLYALSLPIVAGMEQQAVEKHFLRHIDNLAARVRLKMEVSGLKSLSIEERSDWVRFVISLRLRKPEMVLLLKNDAASHLRKTLGDSPEEYEALAESGEPQTLEEWTEQRFPGLIENFGLSFFHEVVTDERNGEDIFRMKWWLWDFSRTGRALILADQPCILTSALKSPDCMLALPISPTKAFVATTWDKRTADTLRRQDPKHLAMRINESSVSQAQVRLYARDSSVERFIKNRLRRRDRWNGAPR